MEKVTILGKPCTLKFGKYPNNTIAIECYQENEPWLIATVNWEKSFEGENYKVKCRFPIVVIKNYSENQGVYQDLVSAKVIMESIYLSGTNGTVQLGILTKKWQQIAKAQLKQVK